MAVLFSDLFNRANDNDIADGVTYETVNGPMDLVGNQIVSGSLGSDAAVRVLGGITWPADQYVQVRLVSPQADGVGSGHGVISRASNAAGNTFYRLVANASGWELVRFPAGTSIASGSSPTFANGDILRIEWRGTAYTLLKNGASFATGTNANIASGNPGMGHSSTSSAGSAIDDLEAGTLGDPGGARRSTQGGNKRRGGPKQFKASVGTTEQPTSVFTDAPENTYAKRSTGMGPGRGTFNVRGLRTRFIHSTRDTSPPATNIAISIDAQGIVTLAGQSGFVIDIGVPIGANGVLTLAGQSLTHAINVAVGQQGVLTINGQTIQMDLPLSINIDTAGQLTLAGQAVTFNIGMPVGAGALSIDGRAFTFQISVPIGAQGVLTLSGQTITLDAGGNLALLIDTPGALSLTGQDLTLDATGQGAIASDWIVRARRRKRR